MSLGSETPFILISRIQVKIDKVQKYLFLAAKTHKAAEDSEQEMIQRTFDKDPKILFVLLICPRLAVVWIKSLLRLGMVVQ